MLQLRDVRLGLRRNRRVPLILQQERAECGFACAAMVASYYGKNPDLGRLRNRVPVSSRGSTLQDLTLVCEELQLDARALRLSLSELDKLRMPAILHWEMQHFVVLVKTRRKSIVINDPATGRRVVDTEELDAAFTGVALELTPADEFEKCAGRSRVALVDFVRSYRRLLPYLLAMLALTLVVQLLALIPAIATQLLIDELTLGYDTTWLRAALAGLGVVLLVSVVIEASRRWIGLYAGTNMAADTISAAIRHVLSLPPEYHRERHTGDLISRIESLTPIRQAITDDGINAIVQLLVLMTTLGLMYFYSTLLMLVSLAGTSLSLVILATTLPAQRRLGAESLIHFGRQNSSLMQSLFGVAQIQSLGLLRPRLAAWQKHYYASTNARVRQSKLGIIQNAAGAVVGAVEQILFLGIGIVGVAEKEITIGVLFAFMSLRGRFANAAVTCTSLLQRFYLLRTHLERVSDFLLAAPQQDSGDLVQPIKGDIRARDLRFAYPGCDSIFENFSCNIAAGSSTVITGPSGCGKSTLLRILSARLQPTGGVVDLDTIRLSMWRQSDLRRRMAVIQQDDILFQGSIADNICGFDPAHDLMRLREAACYAEIWADIESMPMLHNTQIDESASVLSGGQRQRILLARALYTKPDLLFLDEATNQLDVVTEDKVMANLQSLAITLVSVAHRPGVISRAGQVIQLS